MSAFAILLCHDYIRTDKACQANLERRHIEAKTVDIPTTFGAKIGEGMIGYFYTPNGGSIVLHLQRFWSESLNCPHMQLQILYHV